MMTDRIAKPVVKNKFWVVEDAGEKVATIQATADGGFVYVNDQTREHFPSVNVLKKKYNIKFSAAIKSKKAEVCAVYGYPVAGKVYNQVYDIKRKLPIYSKSLKSKSLFCAGYYLIKLNGVWTDVFCPKNITLNRYEFLGPYRNEAEMKEHLRKQNA